MSTDSATVAPRHDVARRPLLRLSGTVGMSVAASAFVRSGLAQAATGATSATDATRPTEATGATRGAVLPTPTPSPGLPLFSAATPANPLPLIPDSQFPNYLLMRGAGGADGSHVNGLRFNNFPFIAECALTFGMFIRPQDFMTFGCMVCFGNDPSGNVLGMFLDGNNPFSPYAFETDSVGIAGNNEYTLCAVNGILPMVNGSVPLAQWSFVAFLVAGPRQRQVVLSPSQRWPAPTMEAEASYDVFSGCGGTIPGYTPPVRTPWPNRALPMKLLFGAVDKQSDPSAFNGGMAGIFCLKGIATMADLMTYRSSRTPAATAKQLWGANLWGVWPCDTDYNTTGGLVRDVSGNGNDLTPFDSGTAANHAPPVFITPSNPPTPTI